VWIRCWCWNARNRSFAVDLSRAQRRANLRRIHLHAARFDVRVDPLLVLERGK
jgi:hypothetical protein